MRKNRTGSLTVIIALTVLAYIILSFIPVFKFKFPVEGGDTSVYLSMGAAPLFSKEIWLGLRPFFTGLVYKILQNDLFLIYFVQTLCSVLAWIFLALEVNAIMRSQVLKIVAVAAILFLSLSNNISTWNGILLSESFAYSLSAILLASAMRFYRNAPLKLPLILIIAIILWASVRETHSILLLPIVVIFGVIALLNTSRRRSSLILSVICLIVFAFQNASSNSGYRWVFPMLNVLSARILPVPEARELYVSQGMPMSEALMKQSGLKASANDWAYYKDPKLNEFRKWFTENGKQTYIKYLLTDPQKVLSEIWAVRHFVFNPVFRVRPREAERVILPPTLNKIFYPTIPSNLLAMILYCGVFFALCYFRERFHPGWKWPVLLIILAIPHIFLIVHGDAMELGRHSVLLAAQIRVALLMCVLLLLDYFMERKQRGQNSDLG